MSDERLGPPPVEPMSNAAWARVERGLWDKLEHAPPPVRERARVRWPWLVGPAVLAAAVIAIVLAARGTTPPQPTRDEVSRVVAGETPTAVSFGDAHLALDARTAIVMQREAAAPSVLVERGAVTFNVAPRDNAPFVVRAGDVTVRVVGTQFRVARFDERVTVSVEHGLVDVQFRGSVKRLAAGERWDSEPEVTSPKTISERERFEQYTALERRDPAAALAGYLELARGDSQWAPVALYAAGRLAADRHDKGARALLEQYLKRFPDGANAQDARTLLSRL